ACAFASGVVSATMSWAGGERDESKLMAYFGIGFLMGFVTGSGGFGISGQLGHLGKIVVDTEVSLMTSMLKKAVDPNNDFQISLWAVSLTFSKDGSVNFNGAYKF